MPRKSTNRSTPNRLITSEEAAQIIGVTQQRVRAYCRQKRLGTKVGRAFVIPLSEARAFKPNPHGVHLDR